MTIKKVPAKKRDGTPTEAIIVVLSEEEYQESANNYAGYCLACGAEASGVEPDARRYECETCNAPRVYGTEELLMMGRIELEGAVS